MSSPKYYISKDNEFVIENYNQAPTFSSFFPGIAGVFGCPMWVFYANRGQCITSAGVHDKDSAIIEFRPANKAHRAVSLQGFRTFLKVDGHFYEPFSELSSQPKEMRITAHGLKIVEQNKKLKIKIEVEYFTVPDEQFPGLARSVKVTNLSSQPRNIEIIDGLPAVVPYGFNNDLLKRISQTTEAWVIVENLANKAPFYKLKVTPVDISETQVIEKGNFYVPFCFQHNKVSSVEIIVDPSVVFGQVQGLERPDVFVKAKNFKVPAQQQKEGFIPAALAYKKIKLAKHGDFSLCSILGQADNLSLLNKIRKRVVNEKYFEEKAGANKKLINDICSAMEITSSSISFDLYSKQTFLDNTMRGGLPVDVDDKVLYLYYRKHGDMERDYNDFKLMPAYFSQGNGNYRDINQNRRNDTFFNPRVGADNITRFFNLIQLDGFNPLLVLGRQFIVKSAQTVRELVDEHINNAPPELTARLMRNFVLGVLLKDMETAGIEYRTSRDEFVVDLIDKACAKEMAVHVEGFWIDHSFYNTDLLESYECLFPEKINHLLFKQKVFTFYDNDHVVASRKFKYRVIGDQVRQYASVKADLEKAALLSRRSHDRNIVRTNSGKGKIYQTTLLVKLLCLAANKVASFDAEGIGLSMEADKPDWYDALNGLPALLGSSLSETLELKRLCAYVLDRLDNKVAAAVPVEIKDLMDKLSKALDKFFNSPDSFAYWDESYKLKEDYRHQTKLGLSGEETEVSGKEAAAFLSLVIKKCDTGIRKCLDKYKDYYTYFINEVVDYETINGGNIKVKKFSQKPLPLFLEGFVHALKVEKDLPAGRHGKKIYQHVKNSPLYDKELKMYKVNASLAEAPLEIGRAKVFSPGWLENESIWLHMEYKYMLELLKAGLYDEFFSDAKNVFVPFLDPKKYKRSILENSSFIASSAHPNKDKHGRGFVARLSGGSAEFIDMWLIMTTGKKIFHLDKSGKLCFKLAPILPAWLFNKGKLIFKLLGSIEVTYLNPKKKNTYGKGVAPTSYKLILENDQEIEINQPCVPEPYASQIRDRKVKKICCHLE